MINPPCERLLVIACGRVGPPTLETYLARLRQQVAVEIRLAIATAGTRRRVARPWSVRYRSSATLRQSTDHTVVPHRRLAQWAQTALVLPASAAILAKAANGIADDPASTLVLAAPMPVVFAPAMDKAVWDAPAVRRNVGRLREDGHYVIEPVAVGDLAATARPDSHQKVGPTLELVLTHAMHVILKLLRQAAPIRESHS